jgi:hypothetical protein
MMFNNVKDGEPWANKMSYKQRSWSRVWGGIWNILLIRMAKKTNANIYKQESNSLSITKKKRCAKYNSNAIAIL